MPLPRLINFIFSFLDKRFMRYSAFEASLLSLYCFEKTSVTGLRLLVYLAPFPELCCLIRLIISVVIPVYKELSLHSTMYKYHTFVIRAHRESLGNTSKLSLRQNYLSCSSELNTHYNSCDALHLSLDL